MLRERGCGNAHDLALPAAFYPNSAPDTDTLVRPTASGEVAIESLRGTSAPRTFSWKVGIPPGDVLQTLSNGGIAVVDPCRPSAT